MSLASGGVLSRHRPPHISMLVISLLLCFMCCLSYPIHLNYTCIYKCFIISKSAESALSTNFFFPFCMTPMIFFNYTNKSESSRNSCPSSSCSYSNFWAFGHVGNSRVSSFGNLQCHLKQGLNTYLTLSL